MESALITFARFGYRRTSMDEVAKVAGISRPGLYYLFTSKEGLFRSAVEQALQDDLGEVERILGETDHPLPVRLLNAFDRWAGRYVGPLARDIPQVIDDNPDLLRDIVVNAPSAFAHLVTTALNANRATKQYAAALSQTMISTSIGIKYQVEDRNAYRERFAVALDLLLH